MKRKAPNHGDIKEGQVTVLGRRAETRGQDQALGSGAVRKGEA